VGQGISLPDATPTDFSSSGDSGCSCGGGGAHSHALLLPVDDRDCGFEEGT